MSLRRKARETALQIIFKNDFNTDQIEIDQAFVNSRLANNAPLIQWSLSLVNGVSENLPAIDEQLKSVLENWNLERLFAADRSIIRLGAYEIIFTDTPPPVVINEAIELSKRYGHENSSQFVNGVLDRLLKKQSGETA